MNRRNVDTRIESITELESPDSFTARMPVPPDAEDLVAESREEIRRIITGEDDRMLMIVGPCSIDDVRAGLQYAGRLAPLAKRIKDRILTIMRVYIEKPHTTTGCEGLVYDPHFDETFAVPEGMETTRRFLLSVLHLGLPTATEWLDNLLPQYLADTISWGAIGARSVEDQTHRRLPSGLSMPIGYKNGTEGTKHAVQVAVDAIVAAGTRHAFLSTASNGHAAFVITNGNPDGHIVLRGGTDGPNYSEERIADAVERLQKAGLPPFLMIDCSHGNSGKDHRKQRVVFRDGLRQRLCGNESIVAMMVESYLEEGRDPSGLCFGKSRTDACISFDEASGLLLWAYDQLDRGTSFF